MNPLYAPESVFRDMPLFDMPAPPASVREPDQPCHKPVPGLRRDRRLNGPVFLRNERLDLGLARADEAQRHRLHPSGRPAAGRLAPHKRRRP